MNEFKSFEQVVRTFEAAHPGDFQVEVYLVPPEPEDEDRRDLINLLFVQTLPSRDGQRKEIAVGILLSPQLIRGRDKTCWLLLEGAWHAALNTFRDWQRSEAIMI